MVKTVLDSYVYRNLYNFEIQILCAHKTHFFIPGLVDANLLFTVTQF